MFFVLDLQKSGSGSGTGFVSALKLIRIQDTVFFGVDEYESDSSCAQGSPISWFNLGVTGVIVGVLLAFYNYAR